MKTPLEERLEKALKIATERHQENADEENRPYNPDYQRARLILTSETALKEIAEALATPSECPNPDCKDGVVLKKHGGGYICPNCAKEKP